MAAIRFKWTVRLDNGDYYVDETIGENSAPIVNGPMSREAAVQMVDDRESAARRRFEQLKSEMTGTRRRRQSSSRREQRGVAPADSQVLPRRSEKIFLARSTAGMAQDVVGRRDMKEELRNAERQQQRFAR
jgi:hypothetical protein